MSLFLIVRATEVLHQVGLLPETVEAEDALIGPHPGVSPEVDVDIGFGRVGHGAQADGWYGHCHRVVYCTTWIRRRGGGPGWE